MSGATADRYGIPRRGYLRPGYKADITVLDPAKLGVDEKKPDAKPGGIEYVYVNGKAVLEEGRYVGGRAGEVVLKDRI